MACNGLGWVVLLLHPGPVQQLLTEQAHSRAAPSLCLQPWFPL
jgi:hypothetical protein